MYHSAESLALAVRAVAVRARFFAEPRRIDRVLQRLARGVARDGEAARATWVERWMPMEDRYVERDDPVACADLVVDGAG